MKRRNLAGGVILILVGILVLLGNFNIIHANVWELLWPLLLIWVGVQLLLRPRWRSVPPTGEHVTLPSGIRRAAFIW